jgi:glyoxylase-like metal-dependent hydrolase (beta-lactamase superfamily II)
MRAIGVSGRWSFLLGAVAALCGIAAPAGAGQAPPPVLKQVAPDLYFDFDESASNSIIWVTAEGVLVVDTKQHPRQAQALVARIRSITDKPIRWAFITQFHGDHLLGTQVLKEAGATIVSQSEVARIIQRYLDKELSRRQRFFANYQFDPKEISLPLPDVTFETRMTIGLGAKVAQLIYLGPGQDPGNAFVYFPHAKALATGGGYVTRSWANPMFTPSVDAWIAILRRIQAMDVDLYLPGHGDVGSKRDVDNMIGFLTALQAGVKDGIAKGMSGEAIAKTLTFPQYKDWRNADLAPAQLQALHHLFTTGKSVYLDRE